MLMGRLTDRFSQFMLISLIFIVVVEGGVIIQMLRNRDGLSENLSISTELRFGLSTIWAGLAVSGIIGLLRSRIRRRIVASLIAIAYLTYSGLYLLLLTEADYDRQRIPFMIVCVSCIVLGIIALGLLSVRGQSSNRTGEIE